MNKKLWLLVMALVLALALGACGGGETADPTEAPAPTDAPAANEEAAAPAEDGMMAYPDIEPVKIALIMPSTITDVSWSQSIYDSLVAIQDHYGKDVVEIAY